MLAHHQEMHSLLLPLVLILEELDFPHSPSGLLTYTSLPLKAISLQFHHFCIVQIMILHHLRKRDNNSLSTN
jgi:hypothetical protein